MARSKNTVTRLPRLSQPKRKKTIHGIGQMPWGRTLQATLLVTRWHEVENGPDASTSKGSDSDSEGSSSYKDSNDDAKVEVRVARDYAWVHVESQSKVGKLGPWHPDLDAHLYHLNNRRGER